MPQTKTALIVDDSTIARLIIRRALPAHYQVVEATDGEEALTRYQEARPDIVFLDLLLPKLDGTTVLSRIKESDPHPQVVVVTANVQQSVKERLLEMGALAVIEKPASRPKAMQAIRDLLERLEEQPSPLALTPIQQETLAEVINIGVGRAARTLSDLINEPVELQVPEVGLYPVEVIERRLASLLPERVTSVHQFFSGTFSGDALLVFPVELAQKLVRLVIRRQGLEGRLLETDLTTLTEIGNLVINAALGTFGEMLQTEIIFSVPDITVETLGSIVRSIARERVSMVQYFILIRARFFIAQEEIEGHLVLLIGVESVELLLQAVERLIRETVVRGEEAATE